VIAVSLIAIAVLATPVLAQDEGSSGHVEGGVPCGPDLAKRCSGTPDPEPDPTGIDYGAVPEVTPTARPTRDPALPSVDPTTNCGLTLQDGAATSWPHYGEHLDPTNPWPQPFGALADDPAARDAAFACWAALAPTRMVTKLGNRDFGNATAAWEATFVGIDPFSIEVAARAFDLDPFALALVSQWDQFDRGKGSLRGNLLREGISVDGRGTFFLPAAAAKRYGLKTVRGERAGDDRDDPRLAAPVAAVLIRNNLDATGTSWPNAVGLMQVEGVSGVDRIKGYGPVEFFAGAIEAGDQLHHAELVDAALRVLNGDEFDRTVYGEN
jgi:hypothetical protein